MTIRTPEERAGERDKASVNDVYLFESVLMHNEYIHPKNVVRSQTWDKWLTEVPI